MMTLTNQELRHAAKLLERMGKRGDTVLAHLNRREVALLKAHGGAGDRNPRTGLLEFDSESGGEGPGAEGGHGGGGDTGGPGTGSSDSSAEGGQAEGGGGNRTGGPGGTHGTQGVADVGVGAMGPGPGVSFSGPSPASLVGNMAAGLAGLGIPNSISSIATGGKSVATMAAERAGLSSTPMGTVSFGGTPGNVGPGAGIFGGGGGGLSGIGGAFSGSQGNFGGGQGSVGGGSLGPQVYGLLHPDMWQTMPGMLNFQGTNR